MDKDYIKSLEAYKDYPIESPRKRAYDYYHLPFAKFLEVHYSAPDENMLRKWNWWHNQHIIKAFDESSNQVYQSYVNNSQAPFFVDANAVISFYVAHRQSLPFDDDITRFIAFLCGGVFFDKSFETGFLKHYHITFDEWLKLPNWVDPSMEPDLIRQDLISLSQLPGGPNYIRVYLSTLPLFDQKNR